MSVAQAQAKFDKICRWEHKAATATGESKSMMRMLIMQNQQDRTVGDGYTTGQQFCDLQRTIARSMGEEHSKAYRDKVAELNETYQSAKKGKLVLSPEVKDSDEDDEEEAETTEKTEDTQAEEEKKRAFIAPFMAFVTQE